MPAPDPKILAVDVTEIVDKLRIVMYQYRWHYLVAYSKTVRGDIDAIHGKGVSDPTAGAFLANETSRRHVDEAARQVRHALTSLRRAEELLRDRGPAEVGPSRGPMITQDELLESKRNQGERLRRGEGFGDESLSCT